MHRPILIKTSGNPYAFGFLYGMKTAASCRAAVRQAKKYFPKYARVSWNALLRASKRLLPPAEKFAQNFIDEIEGMAFGAGVSFEDLWLLNVEEEIVDQRLGLKPLRRNPPPLSLPIQKGEKIGHCTTIAVCAPHPSPLLRRRGNVFYLAHNEDWMSYAKAPLVVAKVLRPDLFSYLSVAYPGTLPGSVCGVNSARIAFNENSFEFPPQVGIPKNFIKRKLLDARNAADVRKIISVSPRAISSNTIFVSAREGILSSAEATPKGIFFLRPVRGALAHTNHTLHPSARSAKEQSYPGSFARYEAAAAFLKNTKKITPASLRRALLSPSIFRRAKKFTDSQTIATIAMSVGKTSRLAIIHHRIKGLPRVSVRL